MQIRQFVTLLIIWSTCFWNAAYADVDWASDQRDIIVICENWDITKTAFTLKATGAATITYSIGNSDSVPFDMCDGGDVTGEVCAQQELDREAVDEYKVTAVATATDSEATLTITVKLEDANDNEPIFQDLPYLYEVLEGTAVDSFVKNLTAIDVDINDAGVVTLFLANGDDDGGMFHLDEESLLDGKYVSHLTITRVPDFEISQIYVGTVTAQDKGSSFGGNCGVVEDKMSTQNIYLNVNDAPDTPPIFDRPSYSAEIEENSGTLNLNVSARDGDYGLNWEITYDLKDGYGIFSIDPDTGVLSADNPAKIDRESDLAIDGYYELSITAYEIDPMDTTQNFSSFPGAQSSSVQATIYVLDQDDNTPQFYSDSSYQTEVEEYHVNVSESTIGPISGFTMYIEDKDQSENAEFSLSISGDDASCFEINPSEGISRASIALIVKEDCIDFEKQDEFSFEVEAYADETNVMKANLIVSVLDENDNLPVFTETDVTVSIPEQSLENAPVVQINVTDEDSGEYGQISFSIQPADQFSIDDEGNVAVITVLDREVREEYYLTVIAKDGGGFISTTQLTVILKDVNDQTPKFLQDNYVVNWDENEENVVPITIRATDNDKEGTENSDLTFFIDDDTLNYNLDQDVIDNVYIGEITPAAAIDAENVFGICNNGIIQFKFNVNVRDGGIPELSSSSNVTVYLRDVNDNTPYFDSSDYQGSVSEESAAGTVITQVSAKDDDKCSPNNDLTYLVDDEYSDKFIMNEKDGAWGLEMRISTLDRQDADSYEVIIYAVDSGQPRMTGNATVMVTITDINNKVPQFVNTPYGPYDVYENMDIGYEIGAINATDEDLDSELKYTIEDVFCTDELGYRLDSTVCSEWFKVYPNNGTIYVSQALDRETVEQVSLILQVQDMKASSTSSQPDQTQRTEITINILDFNDNAPEFTNPDIEFTVTEEVDNGTVIGRVSATDKDTQREITFTTDSKYIAISSEGEVTAFGSRINREGDPGENFVAIIFATDSGVPPLTSNISVNFDVADSNDNNPVFKSNAYECGVRENEMEGTSVCQITATDDDIDENGRISYSLPDTVDFTVNSTTGEIKTYRLFDREEPGYPSQGYRFKLRARDNAENLARETEVDVVVIIEDLDDNDPTYASVEQQALELVEGNDPGELIGTVTKAYDADTDENQDNSYFLVYKEACFDTFTLDEKSRELTAVEEIDREANSSYTLYVLTTRNASVDSCNYNDYQESDILTVTLNILDINDNKPEFERDMYTTDLLYDDNYDTSYVVFTVVATDPDFGINSSLKYSIITQAYDPRDNGVIEPDRNDFEINEETGQITFRLTNFESPVIVGGLFVLSVEVVDGGGLKDETTVDIKLIDATETVILWSRIPEEELEANKYELEKDLEAALVDLDADVVIDKIVAEEDDQGNAAQFSGRSTASVTLTYFHATKINETSLIPAEVMALKLDTNDNNWLLVKWSITDITIAGADQPEDPNKEDLLKVALAVVTSVLVLFLAVLIIAMICMRRSYKRKLKVAESSLQASHSLEKITTNEESRIPGTNRYAAAESKLYLEDQKGNVNLDWQKDPNDDNNSIDDNAVDSQDSAIGDQPGSRGIYDDLDDVDIDFDGGNDADLANLQNALNRKGTSGMVFDNQYTEEDSAVL